jgi:hypothetical protein
MFPVAILITNSSTPYYQPRPCAQIAFQLGPNPSSTLFYYPECASYFSGAEPQKVVLVQATFQGGPERLDQIGACLGAVFGMGLWVALWVQAVGVEVYVSF